LAVLTVFTLFTVLTVGRALGLTTRCKAIPDNLSGTA
jgi:hypothetical protein